MLSPFLISPIEFPLLASVLSHSPASLSIFSPSSGFHLPLPSTLYPGKLCPSCRVPISRKGPVALWKPAKSCEGQPISPHYFPPPDKSPISSIPSFHTTANLAFLHLQVTQRKYWRGEREFEGVKVGLIFKHLPTTSSCTSSDDCVIGKHFNPWEVGRGKNHTQL